jgi:3-deoxy-7-phosphoheptulonate synthase
MSSDWDPESWRAKLATQQIIYSDAVAVERAVARLGAFPPLVTSWEVERLKQLLADAQIGERFLLQGGDCAETLADCRPSVIAGMLKILLQMALVLVHGGQRPVIRVGRFAGQYAKPRSSPIETRLGKNGEAIELPSYFGDLVNQSAFDSAARAPDPGRLIVGYQHAALTLNFIRSLSGGGFADMHHPEYWDVDFVEDEDLAPELRDEYRRLCDDIGAALRFAEAVSDRSIDEVSRAEFFTSHEGLNLLYESAQTHTVPRREGYYDLTTHLPWIGERTREIDGAHVEFFRGIRNPVGVKLGPTATPDEVLELAKRLNPEDEPGKLLLIVRMGADQVASRLPLLIEAMKTSGRRVLWVCDPMHGNTRTTASGVKTRRFDDVLREVELSFDVHEASGSTLGGVHFELTGEYVTECIGGATGVTEDDLVTNYTSQCDPRLNYAQSLEMAFRIAHRIKAAATNPF